MADRNINFDPTVTQVTPEKSALPGIIDAGADIADSIATMSANAKALNATTQTALAFRQADAQFRQDAASNPQDPDALKTLQDTRAQITSTIGQQVPAIASREYMSHVMEVQQNSDKLNELWGMQQSVKNAHADVNTSMASQAMMMAQKGRDFGADGGNVANLDAVLSLEQNNEAIAKFATPVLGESQTLALMKNSNRDNVQAFVSGLAENHPDMAAAALQQDSIKTHFTPAEIDSMGQLIKKTQKTQALLQDFTTTKNDGGLLDLVNNPDMGYAEKSYNIHRGIVDGSISSKSGNAAISLLHSQAAVDAQTDQPVMKAIISQATDLNTTGSLDQKKYMLGVRDLHTQIMQKQSDGLLTQDDATKLTYQVNTMMEKKVAKATGDVTMGMSQATKQFDTLPQEYRAKATQQLFYASVDDKLTPQQLNARATAIVQQMNTLRRQEAQKTLNGVTNDDEFIKSSGYTMADVQETAKIHGISTQDVILRMRATAGSKARAQQTQLKSLKGARSIPTDEGGSAATTESNPQAEPEDNELSNEMNQ